MSYAHYDNEHDKGQLTEFRKELAGEIQAQTGKPFDIFQDCEDIHWGQQWDQCLEESLDEVTFLIPILTPSFFTSEYCQKELKRFLKREKDLHRKDLILPVYYISCRVLDDEEERRADKLAQIIWKRHYADWRKFRGKPFTNRQVQEALITLAGQISKALGRVQPQKKQIISPALPAPKPLVSGEHCPMPKPGITTLVVDPMHRGNYDTSYSAIYDTISEAMQAANPGNRILVYPGLYEGYLAFEKPLEIMGIGDRGEVAIQAKWLSTLIFRAAAGKMTNLTLRQLGTGIFGGPNCIQIEKGRLELVDCDITNKNEYGPCVLIGSGGEMILRRNRIHDSKGAGVRVEGLGLLEDNDIFGNAESGVEIREGGHPTMRRNRIHRNHAGVFIYNNGQGILEDNDIFGNACSGIQINECGNPTLQHNRIHDNKLSGVLIGEKGLGQLEDNDIFGNAKSGVEIREGGNPTLRRNRIHRNQTGVLIIEKGLGTIEENDIFGNAYGGVQIGGGNPTLQRNRIHDNESRGVLFYKNGIGTLEDNDIFGNDKSGVEIAEGGNPTLRKNRINKNGDHAVWIHDGGGGTIEDNDLRDNAKGAWDIAADCEAKIKRSGNLE